MRHVSCIYFCDQPLHDIKNHKIHKTCILHLFGGQLIIMLFILLMIIVSRISAQMSIFTKSSSTSTGIKTPPYFEPNNKQNTFFFKNKLLFDVFHAATVIYQNIFLSNTCVRQRHFIHVTMFPIFIYINNT